MSGPCRIVLALSLLAAIPNAASAKGTESAGVAVAIALPLLAGGYAIYQDDWTGVAQLGVDTFGTVGTAYLLKNIVREQRPDKSDYQSFPSDTSALAFAPAQFLWDRYGWEVGLPAYAAAGFVGWSRIDAKQHHWYDVAASAGLAFGFSKIFTTRYRPRGLSYGVNYAPGGGYAALEYRF
ncbi:MAG TPA: phosphatase PAP2 family protein [Rhizomicrobium sp.]|jgi:membrane-associated phospholipid phosphatase|nr:phosphatase PAP2 family protein [Rhizomicrobium sp.]